MRVARKVGAERVHVVDGADARARLVEWRGDRTCARPIQGAVPRLICGSAVYRLHDGTAEWMRDWPENVAAQFVDAAGRIWGISETKDVEQAEGERAGGRPPGRPDMIDGESSSLVEIDGH